MAESNIRVCDLCCHETGEWAIGECDHPICLRCTTKLRVLCEQNDCPVCRFKLDMVVVCTNVKPFADISRSRMPGDQKYGIYFKTRDLQKSFDYLRGNNCVKCSPNAIFRNFKQLRDHMIRSHELHYCEICFDNLKLLPLEFKTYTRPLLTKHRRDGDADDKSHKGHPMCKFCDDRFLDNDALHTHLRIDHLWCHICEGDGKQEYYKNYFLLRKHFKDGHYLCEEGSCKEEKLTSVFRSQIDIQAHRASHHTRGMSKAEVKQIRQVELGFSYGSGRSEGPRVRTGGQGNSRNGRATELREQEEHEVATALTVSVQVSQEVKKRTSHKQVSPPPQRKSADTPMGVVTQPPPGFNHTIAENGPKKKSIPKHSQEDTKTPPGLNSKPTESLATTNDKITSNGFDPYSNGCKKPEVGSTDYSTTKPPGFNSVPTTKKKEIDQWPEIMANDETENLGPILSELNRLEPPSYVYAGPAGAWTLPNPPTEQQVPVKKNKRRLKPVPGIDAFPPMPSSTNLKPVSDEPPLSRKQVETKVVERIRIILGNDKSRYTEFKTLSGWYRNSEITVHEYMNQCADLFGPNWQEIGPQVAEVFPIERKKFELLSLFHSKPPPGLSKLTKLKKKPKTTPVWTVQTPPTVVRRPKQSVLNDSDYPSLATASTIPSAKINNAPDAWNMIVRS